MEIIDMIKERLILVNQTKNASSDIIATCYIGGLVSAIAFGFAFAKDNYVLCILLLANVIYSVFAIVKHIKRSTAMIQDQTFLINTLTAYVSEQLEVKENDSNNESCESLDEKYATFILKGLNLDELMKK